MAERVGAAPWSVSIAVLCVVTTAMTVAAANGFSRAPPTACSRSFFMLVIGPPVLVAASALLTAVYRPAGCGFGALVRAARRAREKVVVVAVSTALGLLPAVGLLTVVRLLQGGVHEWRQLAMDGLLFAGVLWTISAPASLAVHMTVLREDAGRPVRPVVDILLWGTLLLAIEVTVLLALSTP